MNEEYWYLVSNKMNKIIGNHASERVERRYLEVKLKSVIAV